MDCPIKARNVLRKYDPAVSFKDQKSALGAGKDGTVENLIETLKYLKAPNLRPNLNDYKKEGILIHLICRIQNLLPDTCSFCKEEYCTQIDDPSYLPCDKCGQEPHVECLMTKLGQEALTPEQAKQLTNPFNFPSIIHLCHRCKDDYIPTPDLGVKEAVLRKISGAAHTAPSASTASAPTASASTPSASTASVSTRASTASASTEAESPAAAVPRQGEDSVNELPLQTNEQTLPPEQQDHPPQQTTTTHDENSHVIENSEVNTIENSNRTRRTASEGPIHFPSSIRRDICKMFLKHKCRFGQSGRRGGRCRFKHPTICPNLHDHGISDPYGCNGKECSDFHPETCTDSLLLKRCTDKDCSLFHVKGTERVGHGVSPEISHESGHPSHPPPKSVQQPVQQQSLQQSSSFLDQLRLLEGKIQEAVDRFQLIDTKFVAMDTSLATLNSVISHQQHQQTQTQQTQQNQQQFQQNQVQNWNNTQFPTWSHQQFQQTQQVPQQLYPQLQHQQQPLPLLAQMMTPQNRNYYATQPVASVYQPQMHPLQQAMTIQPTPNLLQTQLIQPHVQMHQANPPQITAYPTLQF